MCFFNNQFDMQLELTKLFQNGQFDIFDIYKTLNSEIEVIFGTDFCFSIVLIL